MNAKQLIAATFAALLIVGAAAPASVAAADDEADLAIETTQSPETGNATVVVTDNGTAVANATLIVESDDYAGTGTYEADANSSVELPNPANTTEVELTAVTDGNATTTEVELVPLSESLDVSVEQADDGTATVTMTQYGAAVEDAAIAVNDLNETDYAGVGTYETDANGTVDLPAPANETTIEVSATSGDLSASTTAELDDGDLDVEVTQNDDRTATVTVTRGPAAVENATVVVESEDDYAGNGTYETDENGTVDLPAPSSDVEVTLTVADDGDSVEETVELAGPAGLEVSAEETDDGAVVTVTDNESAVENATVEVASEGNYSGDGTYETDANGTVDLPGYEGNESVTLDITATYDNETATTTLTLGEEDEENASQPFGQRVSEFVHGLLGDENRTGGIGQEVSKWVREHNPGKAKGPGENPGNGGGPPEHAGPNKGNETADGNETKRGNGNGNAGGPGNGNGNAGGNGNGNGGGPGNGNGNGGGPGNGNGNGGGPGNGGPGNGNGNALIDLPVLPF
jgi:hypothetical protein